MTKEKAKDLGIRNPFIDLEPFLAEELKDTQVHISKGSQTDVYERVCDALYGHPEIDASDIIVSVNNGDVTLNGKVPNREMKWAAESAISEMVGVWKINNNIQVSNTNTPLKVTNH